MHLLYWSLFLGSAPLIAATIDEKIVICGVGKNVARYAAETMAFAEELGEHFAEYRVVIYENNSHDDTAELYKAWAERNPRVTAVSESLSLKQLLAQSPLHRENRMVNIASARNKVLDLIMQEEFAGYAYVLWVDLDFKGSWDVAAIVASIQEPEAEWDALFANGSYDLFALRAPEVPIGYELVGDLFFKEIKSMSRFLEERNFWDSKGPWKRVYSAFGGLGLYKREAMSGCRYSAIVTRDLERQVVVWLRESTKGVEVPFLAKYQHFLQSKTIVATKKHLPKMEKEVVGMRLYGYGLEGEVVWFGGKKYSLPVTCEHVTFHAAMAARGHDKLYINPKICSPPRG